MKWYRLAAEQGDAFGQSHLGIMYNNGQGILQDNVIAHVWLNIGAANGNELGVTDRDSLAERATRKLLNKPSRWLEIA